MGLDAGGGAKLDVSSSVVEFTPPGGATVAIGKGEGLNISPTGSLSQRPINPAISANITSKNSAVTNIASKVPLATVNQAKTKASALITSFNNGSSKGSGNSSETKAKDNQDSKDNKPGTTPRGKNRLPKFCDPKICTQPKKYFRY
jgi:hypothetical protein